MKLRWLRLLLWMAAALLLAALIWWGGPELRIGESRPLDPPGSRLALIALMPLLLLIPVISGLLAWSWRQLGAQRTTLAIDEREAACADLLGHLNRSVPHGTNWRQAGRRLLRQCLPGFSPDVLIVATTDQAQTLQRLWPWDMDGAISHPEAGDAFWSGGRCWLVLTPQALPAWAAVLRWRRAAHAVVWVVDAATGLPGRVVRPAHLDEARVHLGQLRRRTGRQPALWMLLWNPERADEQSPWERGMEAVPRGFILPLRAPLHPSAWRALKTRFVQLLLATVRAPDVPPSVAQSRLSMLHACTDQLAAAPAALRQMSGGDGVFAVARPRAVFWSWCTENACIGLEGLLDAAVADRPPLRWTMGWTAVRALMATTFIVGVLTLALQVSWLRSIDHALALQRWRTRLPEVQTLASKMAPDAEAHPGQRSLDLLHAIEGLQVTARNDTSESLPDSAAVLLDNLEARLWERLLQPDLLAWNRLCLNQRKTATPADVYRSLATALMLKGSLKPEEIALRGALLQCGATAEQAEAAGQQLMRRQAPPEAATGPSAGDDEIVAWRAHLRGPAHWTLEERIWHGMSTEMGPVDAHDFDLIAALGPASTWFSAGVTVPWLYTSEGLRLGYHPAAARYDAWAREYASVMDEPQTLPHAQFEALVDRLRVRYVQEATTAWERMFAKTTLAPVKGVAESAERAQVFGSDTSPFIHLLDVLEQQMPLPPRKNLSLWSRLKQRIVQDWARMQYELGWRGSPRAPLPVGDPAFSMAQNFGLLRSYFSDIQGKSPARDRMLQTIQGVGRFLNQQQAAEEFGSRTPPTASLNMLRVQAQRLPSPLRRLVTEMAVSTGQQIHKEQAEKLALNLDAVGVWRACQLDPPFPLQLSATSELSWESFAEDLSPQGRLARIVEASGDMIDTTTRPWRLRLPQQQVGASAQANSQLRWLQRASRLTKAWFPNSASGLQLSLRPVFMDSNLLEVRMLIGGQPWSYAHGAVAEAPIRWPGTGGEHDIEVEFRMVSGARTQRRYTGPWALMRLARDAKAESTTAKGSGQMLNLSGADGGVLRLEVTANGEFNPLDSKLYDGLCEPQVPSRQAANAATGR